jgi:hypothetical protein
MFKKLSNLFSPKPPEAPGLDIYVRCLRCREILSTRINLHNDLSMQDDDTYFARKTLVGDGENRCFQKIEVSLSFDQDRNLMDHEVSGGLWLTPEEAGVVPPEADA